jgi:hypothetical protein
MALEARDRNAKFMSKIGKFASSFAGGIDVSRTDRPMASANDARTPANRRNRLEVLPLSLETSIHQHHTDGVPHMKSRLARFSLYAVAVTLAASAVAALALIAAVQFADTAMTIQFFDHDFDRTAIAQLNAFELVGLFLACAFGILLAILITVLGLAIAGVAVFIGLVAVVGALLLGALALLSPIALVAAIGFAMWWGLRKLFSANKAVA